MLKIKTMLRLLLLVALISPAAASAAGGFAVWEGSVIDNNAQTILPAGTLNSGITGAGVSLRWGIHEVTTNTIDHSSQSKLTYGGTTSITRLTGLTLQINVDGSFTVQRTAGSEKYNIVLRLLWM